METWYKVQFDEISRVNVISSTEHFVTLSLNWEGGKTRSKRITSWRSYFPTWKEAHAHLLKQAQKDFMNAKEGVKQAQQEVIEAEDNLVDVKAMTEPSHAT